MPSHPRDVTKRSNSARNVLSRADWSIVLATGLLAVVVVSTWSVVLLGGFGPQRAPFEDAAMLFRYAEIFAEGGGIAFNFAEHPGISDGATDLGFVLALAPLIWLGLDSTIAAFLLNTVGIFGIGSLFGAAFISSRVRKNPRNVVFLAGAVVLVMSGPVHNYLAAGFSPPIFGFFLTAAGFFGFQLGKAATHRPILGLCVGLVGGLAGLWRPEGFFLGPFFSLLGYLMAASLFRGRSLQNRLRDFFIVATPVVIIVAGYSVFRLSYFGRLFPTSAVNKAQLDLNIDNAFSTAVFIGILAAFFIVLILTSAMKVPLFAPTFVAGLLVSSAFWVPFQLTLNWWMRMQWPLVPAIAIIAFLALLPLVLKPAPPLKTFSHQMISTTGMVALFLFLAGTSQATTTRAHGSFFETRFHLAVSEELQRLDTEDLKLATTEAGLIPLRFSGKVLDTWGHNHREIASNSDALPRVIKEFGPDLLIIHGPNPKETSQQGCSSPPFTQTWITMTIILIEFAEESGMNLLRVDQTGSCDSWIIYTVDEISADIHSALLSFPPVGETTFIRSLQVD